MPEKLDIIRKQNARWAKESPYNYCDRWCERCPVAIKQGCRLYLDEVGREMANIAHGREADDPKILEEDLEMMEEKLETLSQENDFFQGPDLSPEEEKEILDQIEEVNRKAKAHHLQQAVHQYSRKIHEFLKETGWPRKIFSSEIQYHLQTISWYHTLIPAKMHRALTGLYEADPRDVENFALHDCAAQLDVCRKGVDQSINAFKAVAALLPSFSALIFFLAMLNNIKDQIGLIEQDINEG